MGNNNPKIAIQPNNFENSSEFAISQPPIEPFMPNIEDPAELKISSSSPILPIPYRFFPEKVVSKSDSRKIVKTPSKYPYSAFGLVLAKSKSGKIYQGTGTLIGPNFVITAAQNLKDPSNNEEYTEVRFLAGVHGDKFPYPESKVKKVLISPRFAAGDQDINKHNYALLILEKPLGNVIGWLGLACLTGEVLRTFSINIIGYPSEKSKANSFTLWFSIGKIYSIEEEIINYKVDATPGQSGGGIMVQDETTRKAYIIGIHTHGESEGGLNYGNRFSKQKYERIYEWMEEHVYMDPPQKKIMQWVKEITDVNDAWTLAIRSLGNEYNGQYLEIRFGDGKPENQVILQAQLLLNPKFLDAVNLTDEYLENLALYVSPATIALRLSGAISDSGIYTIMRLLPRTNVSRLIISGGDYRVESLTKNANLLNNLGLHTLELEDTLLFHDFWDVIDFLKHFENIKKIAMPVEKLKWGIFEQAVFSSWVPTSIEKVVMNDVKVNILEFLDKAENEGINFNDELVGEKGMKLLSKGNWEHVNMFNLENCNIEASEMSIFAKGQWQSLAFLNLKRNLLKDPGVKLLSEMNLPNLVTLELKSNEITTEGAIAIAHAKWLALEILNLNDNQIGEAGAKALGEGNWPNLTTLYLNNNHIKSSGLEGLSKGKWPGLTFLALSGNQIDDAGISEMVVSSWQNLTNLNLDNNLISEKGMSLISRVGWKLTNFSISQNKIGPIGAKHIAEAEWPDLKKLSLAENDIKDSGANYIGKGFWPSLNIIDLQDNDISDEGLAGIVKGKWKELNIINLEYNDITQYGASLLANADWPNLSAVMIEDTLVMDKKMKLEPTQKLKALEAIANDQ